MLDSFGIATLYPRGFGARHFSLAFHATSFGLGASVAE
jgi:hypothetical protein